MGSLSKAKVIPLEELYDLDLSSPNDRLEYVKIKLFQQINAFMVKNNINKSELAKRMGKTRQEITNRFSGNSLTIEFLMKVACALGLEVDVTSYVAKKTIAISLFEKIVTKVMGEKIDAYIRSHKNQLGDSNVQEITKFKKNLKEALKKPFYAGA